MLLDGGPDGSVGRHCWDPPHPIVLDMTAAAELGYTPAGDYATTVADEVAWLVAERPPLDEGFFDGFFDYAAEDRYLDSIGLPTTSASRSAGSTES